MDVSARYATLDYVMLLCSILAGWASGLGSSGPAQREIIKKTPLTICFITKNCGKYAWMHFASPAKHTTSFPSSGTHTVHTQHPCPPAGLSPDLPRHMCLGPASTRHEPSARRCDMQCTVWACLSLTSMPTVVPPDECQFLHRTKSFESLGGHGSATVWLLALAPGSCLSGHT